MKKLIIAAALVLASVSAANAGGLKCDIVQILPGLFLPNCVTYERSSYGDNYYRDHDKRWEYHRDARYDYRHRGYWDEGRRHHHWDRDDYDRHHRPDSRRW